MGGEHAFFFFFFCMNGLPGLAVECLLHPGVHQQAALSGRTSLSCLSPTTHSRPWSSPPSGSAGHWPQDGPQALLWALLADTESHWMAAACATSRARPSFSPRSRKQGQHLLRGPRPGRMGERKLVKVWNHSLGVGERVTARLDSAH